MKKGFLSKKIPTIFGLILLAAGITGGIYFLKQNQVLDTGPKASSTPQKIKITNIADDQFTVSWITQEPTVGQVKFGLTTKLESTAKDDRDKLTGEQTDYNTHFITVRSLSAEKKYYFKIESDKRLFDNNGQPYEVILSPKIGTPGEAKIVSGKVFNINNKPAKSAIVYLSSSNIAPASTLTDKEGRWAIYLNKARTTDLKSYAQFDPEATILNIEADSGLETATATTITKNAFPVPDIILGQGPFDFRDKAIAEAPPVQAQLEPQQATASTELTDLQSTPPPAQVPSQFNLQPLASPDTTSYTVIITNPGENGEEIHTTQPEIRGKGPANKVITVKIESPSTQTSSVTIDDEGNWSFTPSDNLEPGEHTVYVSFLDDSGNTQQIARNFVVLAAEDSDLPALTSTPSGSLKPSLAPSPSLIPSPSPLTSPSLSPSPQVRTTMPSTSSGVPTTGTITPTFFVFILGFGLILSGIIAKKFHLVDKP
jgi:hypothetical protein